jgi:hypothetical protein
MWNGRLADDHITFYGMDFASVHAFREGIVTRGVLLDIPRARGMAYLPATDGIHVEDLEAAETLARTTVRPGDAIIVRGGIGARELVEGEGTPSLMAGLDPDCLPWIHDRQVAVFGGDGNDHLPSGYRRVPLPLHQVGMSAMGLCMLDNVETEPLAAHCAGTGVYEFLLAIAPLRIPKATGSAVNPIAAF